MPRLRIAGPWIAVACAWTADIVTALADSGSTPLHGVLDAAAVAATVWVIARSRGRAGEPQPGQRVISDDEFFRAIEAITEGLAAEQRMREGVVPESPVSLRAVR